MRAGGIIGDREWRGGRRIKRGWGIEGDIVRAGSIIGDREWRGGRRIKRGWGIEGINSKVEEQGYRGDRGYRLKRRTGDTVGQAG